MAIPGLSIPGSLFADLRDGGGSGGSGGTQMVSFADSVRAGSANEGTGTPSAPRPRAFIIGIRPLLGIALAAGDEYDSGYIDKGSIFSYGVALEAEYFFTQGWFIASGLTYARKGQYYEKYQAVPVYGLDWLEVDEYVHYLQVPAMVRFRWYNAEKDEVTGELIRKSSGVAFCVGGGVGFDIAVATGGEQSNDNGSDSLDSAYFDDLRRFNVSALGSIGIEYFFKDGLERVGLDLNVDYHLLNDWDFPSGGSSHYFTFTVGVSYRHGIILK
jgi:hypothetical protein